MTSFPPPPHPDSRGDADGGVGAGGVGAGGVEPGWPGSWDAAEAAPGSPTHDGPRHDVGSPTVLPVGTRVRPYEAHEPSDPVAPPPAQEPERPHHSFLRELPILIGIAIVLALLIKTLLLQAFFIPSGSMEQTLHVQDRVLVNKVVYHLRDPHRGEIVVFDTKGTGFEGQGSEFAPCAPGNAVVTAVRAVQRFLGVGTCGDSDFIKRVIAVPGDRVQCCDPQGRVVVNGRSLDETYVYLDNHEAFCAAPAGSLRPASLGDACGPNAQPVVVPAGDYWVMGDHRSDSADSRPNGFVPGDKIVGRAFVRVWPVTRIGFLSVPKTFQQAQAILLQGAVTPAYAAPALLVPMLGWRRLRRRRPSARRRLTGGRVRS